MSATVLIVDDESSIRSSLAGVLRDEGYEVREADGGAAALAAVAEQEPDVVLLDIWMPGMDGIETLTRLKASHPELPVVIMSGHGTIETAVKATKLGAYDFIEKPLSIEKVTLTVRNALEVSRLQSENVRLRQQMARREEMIGQSRAIRELREQIARAAPTNGWILIRGENGTGKELVAATIHRLSRRADQPFVEVNCAAIPEELIESELFGHERGAFTGAIRSRKGKFEQADGGTLFLDEIGDMSLKTQAKVLRVLEEGTFERVGGGQPIRVDVRVIAATNKDLVEEMRHGRFREDLYYRLNVIPFYVPPLRERKEDIPLLVEHFLDRFATEVAGSERKRLAPEALELLMAHDWPGNVRELRNLIERLVIMTPGPLIRAEDVPLPAARAGADRRLEAWQRPFLARSLRDARSHFEREYLRARLAEHGWNISRTAEAIGIERSNLHRKIKQYGIELESPDGAEG
ncbi:MAG TPA: sigma-54 dependent transcriptional regulator [Thermodesulfobacteriota bacterium]|nr:sigma-54 dependent transcriptional regulator [Thermodesulfobacteriota bacterium]